MITYQPNCYQTKLWINAIFQTNFKGTTHSKFSDFSVLRPLLSLCWGFLTNLRKSTFPTFEQTNQQKDQKWLKDK